jgi:NADH-quinone oxidoreductase subunit K
MNPLICYQVVAVLLLGLGLYALVARRTLIGMLIGVELMLNGAGLSIVAAAQLTPTDAVLGQLGALLVMGLAAAAATLKAPGCFSRWSSRFWRPLSYGCFARTPTAARPCPSWPPPWRFCPCCV